MTKRLSTVLLLAACGLLAEAQAAPIDQTPWSIETSLNLRYAVDLDEPIVQAVPARPFLPSPDGSKFAVLLRQGEANRDDNLFELMVFNTVEVTQSAIAGTPPPAPFRILQMRSSSSVFPGIAQVSWSAGGLSLHFDGVTSSSDALAQPVHYEWDLRTGRARVVCQCVAEGPVTVGHLIDTNNGISLFTRPASLPPTRVRYPAQFLSPQFFHFLLFPDFRRPDRQTLFIDRRGEIRQLAVFHEDGAETRGAISPNGRFAIAFLPASDSNSGERRFKVNLIDLHRGMLTTIAEAPAPNEVLWSPDGSRAAIVGITSPNETDGSSWVAIYDLPNARMRNLHRLMQDNRYVPHNEPARWNTEGTQITIAQRDDAGRVLPPVAYQLIGTNWTPAPPLSAVARPQAAAQRLVWETPRHQLEILHDEALASGEANARGDARIGSWLTYPAPQSFLVSNGLRLTLEEGPNQPQQIVASISDHHLTLLDLNPILPTVRIANSESVEWRTDDRQLHRGLLTLPPHLVGGPPALVILLYDYMPNVFRPDGKGFSAFPQQLLAARGMAALEISTYDTSPSSSDPSILERQFSDEASLATKNIDAAIAALARTRTIDPTRVGIIGFSTTGFLARTILIRPGQYPLSAAAANDSKLESLGWLSYQWTAAAGNDLPPGLDGATHGGPFWTNQSRWLQEAPDLAANYATGALLELFHGHSEDLSIRMGLDAVNIVGPFRSAHRPVEFMNIPSGLHFLERPDERAASLNANVDWMDFWLNGHADPDPAKTEQYTRWRAMRTEWQRQQAWENAGHPAGSTPPDNFR